MKEQFEEKGDSYREQYERDLLHLLEGLINDAERKMRRGRERLEVKPNDPSVTHAMGTSDETEEKRALLDLQIKEIVAQIEAAAEQGRLKEVAELTERVDALKAEMNQLKSTIDYDNPLHRLEKRMEVCLTCGALLVINDAPKRVDAHFDGRQHLGWVKLRDTAELLRQKCGSVRFRDRGSSSSRSYDRGSDYNSSRYERRESRDSRNYERDSRDSRDTRDYRSSRDSRDSRDSKSYERSVEHRHPRRDYDDDRRSHRDHRDSRDSRDSYRSDRERLPRRFSDDKGNSKEASIELDYELGEIPEDGEIVPSTRRSRSRSRSRSRDRSRR